MSEVESVKNLLERDWEPSVSGRDTDVPEPMFTLEKSKREARLKHQDVGYVTTGADTNYTPQGLGWTSQQIDTAVAVEYRTTTRSADVGYDDGYNRLFGQRTGSDGVGAPDRWDGIIGETTRIVLDNRKGVAEWDLVGTDTNGSVLSVDDLADLGGKNYYRADVLIPMDLIAQNIDTSV